MKLRSILASMLLAAAPFAGAQSVDHVFVRAAAQADLEIQAEANAAVSEKAEKNLTDGIASTETVAQELDLMLEQRFDSEAEAQAPQEQMLVSAH